jgi:hypothetical protein
MEVQINIGGNRELSLIINQIYAGVILYLMKVLFPNFYYNNYVIFLFTIFIISIYKFMLTLQVNISLTFDSPGQKVKLIYQSFTEEYFYYHRN